METGSGSQVRWIYPHIPKCGGTTFSHVLERTFGAAYRSETPMIIRPYGSADVRRIVTEQVAARCFSSHNFSLDLPFGELPYPLRAITFVRDPVRRFFSHYFYHRHHPRHTQAPAARSMDLPTYTRHVFDGPGPDIGYADGQLSFLTGAATPASLQRLGELGASDEVAILPLHRFDDACVWLEGAFPDTFRDCSYTRRNVSFRDQEPDAEVRALVADRNELDVRLVGWSERWLDARIAQVYGPTELTKARDEFRARCRRKARMRTVRDALAPLARVFRGAR